MKKKLTLGLFWFFISAFGQLENHIWHFGNHVKGIQFDFTTNVPSITNVSYTPYANGTGSTMTNPATGTLFFYSDGQNVIDATHAVMPNGAGLNGAPSTFSSGAACKVPGNCNEWYVFSITTQTEFWPSPVLGNLYYTKVDMDLPGNGTAGGPLGDVIPGQKNILLTNDIAEGIEIIPKANSHDYYLLAGKNATSTIDVFEINQTGISLIGSYPLGSPCTDIIRIRHCPANDKVVVSSLVENEQALLFDFNTTNGVISGITPVTGTPIGSSSSHFAGFVDAEFSIDGTKLYLSKFRGTTPSTGGALYQYDLSLPGNPPILVYSISSSPTVNSKGLQLGPDGKIYWIEMESSTALTGISVINSPNLSGATCDFQLNQLALGSNVGQTMHFFPMIYKYQNSIPQIPDSTINFTCQIPTTFSFDPLSGYTDNESDNLSFSVNSVLGGTVNVIGSTLDFTTDPAFVGNPEIEIIYQDDFCFALSDTFTITLTASAGTGTLTLPDSVITCIGNTITLDAGIGFTSYDWSTGEITQTINVSTTGMYSVETTDGVCLYLDSTYVEFNPPTPVSLGPDQTVCADSLQLSIGAFMGVVNWSDGEIGNSNWVINSGQYSVIAENGSGCLSYDTVDVVINPLPVIDLGPDQQVCNGDQIYLTATGYNSVLWSDASSNDSLLVSASGNFSVTVSNIFLCNATDDITITFNTPVQINLGPDQTICDTDALLAASGFSGSVIWSDGATGNTNLVSNSGEYSVIAEDLNGCESFDTINVFLAPIPTINLGSDTLICPDDFYLVASGFPTVLWSTSETTDSILITSAGLYSVEVINSFGCQASDQISIDILDPTVIDLGPDFESCSQNEVVLSTGLETGIFSWSTEESTSSITVTESGSYYVTQQVCNVSIVDSIRVDITTLNQTVYIPNAFTPDGNTLNPVFEVVFGDYSHVLSYKFLIYNRWGELVFETTDPYEFWNGTGNNGLVQDGVYTYVVKIETDCDENSLWVKRGHVTVLK